MAKDGNIVDSFASRTKHTDPRFHSQKLKKLKKNLS